MTDNRNPLLQDWQTPYQLPPFHQILPEHFAPAFAALFEQHLAEIDALADNQAAPTFDNTVAAFDATGASLDRVRLTFENLCAWSRRPRCRPWSARWRRCWPRTTARSPCMPVSSRGSTLSTSKLRC